MPVRKSHSAGGGRSVNPSTWGQTFSGGAETSTELTTSRSGARPSERSSPAESLALQEYSVRLDTTKGPIVVQVHRDWAPRGADRFYELVRARYFDDTRFFRVVKGQWAQFGINGNPAVATRWRTRTFPDEDPGRRQSNTRGMVAFAEALEQFLLLLAGDGARFADVFHVSLEGDIGSWVCH